jgi:hypothetical protein
MAAAAQPSSEAFYCRYYVGHKGKFGHEFLEFEFRPDGKVCAAASLYASPSFGGCPPSPSPSLAAFSCP